jgi:DHA1 family multidrug resistance protein-like MFS transporter
LYWQRNLWVLAIGTLIANISFTLITPFLPAYLVELGLKGNFSIWSGLIFSITFFTYSLMAPIWGSLADRHGKRVMLLRSGAGIVLANVLMGLATSHWHLLILRGFNGLLSGFIPAAIMLVATNTPEDKMGYALGMINTFIAIGAIMGPSVGGTLVNYFGVRMVMFISAGFLLAATILAFMGTKEEVSRQSVRTSVRQDMKLVVGNKSLQLFFFCMVVLQLTNFMIQPILPLRIGELTGENVEMVTGIIFSIMGISLALGSPVICRITGVKYQTILFSGLVVCGLLNVIQGFTSSIIALGIERFLYGFAIASINVSGNVLITQCAVQEIRGRVFGILNSFTAMGAVVGPLLGGFMGESLGNASPFHGSAFFFFLAAGLLWLTRNRTIEVINTAGCPEFQNP